MYILAQNYATDKYSRKVFLFMKSEESMVGEDSEPEKTCSELAGTHFTIGKKNPMKILEFKRSRIRIIAEFRGILNGFPNQALIDLIPEVGHTIVPLIWLLWSDLTQGESGKQSFCLAQWSQ
jgi:hypothetical protein